MSKPIQSWDVVIAIDPGPTTSGVVAFDGERVVSGDPAMDNDMLIRSLKNCDDPVAIEWISNMGMQVGASVFETCYWVGRFEQARNASSCDRIKRIDVKKHICGQTRAKDANIRAALIDRFGGIEGKAKAIGTKASPGPLYGVKTHMWAALAVAVTWWDMQGEDMT